MDKRQKGCSQFVVAGCNAAENLELIEKAFHQMALLVDMEITRPRINTVFSGRNRIAGFLLCDIVPDLLRTIGFIRENITPFDLYLRKQINSRTCVMYLPTGKQKLDWIAQGIDNSVDFCGLSTPAVADKLVVFRIYSPFFAPALCGCALIEVLSIHRFS